MEKNVTKHIFTFWLDSPSESRLITWSIHSTHSILFQQPGEDERERVTLSYHSIRYEAWRSDYSCQKKKPHRQQNELLIFYTKYQEYLVGLGLIHLYLNHCSKNFNHINYYYLFYSSSDNVNYHVITRCNIDWPNSEKCIEIRYSIGVHYDNETGTYEMTVAHMDDMWKNHANDMNLTTMGLAVSQLKYR